MRRCRACPGPQPQNSRFERPLAERRHGGTVLNFSLTVERGDRRSHRHQVLVDLPIVIAPPAERRLGKSDRPDVGGALRRMARGDWIIFYSPRVTYPDGDHLQAFTAIGQVVDDEPYQASTDDEVWRRNVDFLDCAETPIRPLIDALDFIENKQRWGYKFRFGVFRIDHDFEAIRAAMTRTGRTGRGIDGQRGR